MLLSADVGDMMIAISGSPPFLSIRTSSSACDRIKSSGMARGKLRLDGAANAAAAADIDSTALPLPALSLRDGVSCDDDRCSKAADSSERLLLSCDRTGAPPSGTHSAEWRDVVVLRKLGLPR